MPRSPRSHATTLAVLSAVAVVASWSRHVAAQTEPSLSVRTWAPSIDPNAGMVLEPIQSPGPWQWTLGAWLTYAQSPVVLRDDGGNVLSRPVDHALGADLVAGLGLGQRAAIGVDLPIVLYQDGTTGLPASTVSGGRVPTSSLGDATLLGKGTVVRNDPHGVPLGFGLAILGSVTLPTGDRASFAGDGSATASLRLLAEYALGAGALRAIAGYSARTGQTIWPNVSPGGATFGDSIPWSLGATLRLKAIAPSLDKDDRQSCELALHGSLPAGPVAPFGAGASLLSPALVAISDRIGIGHYRDAFLLLGADVGLDQAVGVPLIRGVVALGWAPRSHDRDGDGVDDDQDECPDLPEDRDGIQDEDGCPEDDADSDGVLDTQDVCPLVPGVWWNDVRKNGCPAPDSDGDGVPDPIDACPAVRGVASDDPKKNGCPPAAQDRDRDGIPDDADKCPDQAEDKDGFEDFDGCPDPDDDGDGIPDAVDACPHEKGEPSTDPTRNGCPNPDRDGDTYDNDVDACPDEAEVFNGVKDDDGCPDEGGRPLASVAVQGATVVLRIARPIVLARSDNGPAIDAKSDTTLRAIARELNLRPDLTLAVGVAPGAGKPEEAQAVAMAKALVLANRIAKLTHRPDSADAVGWDAVKQQPGTAGGIGFAVLTRTPTPPRKK
jgi:hypothetical protein